MTRRAANWLIGLGLGGLVGSVAYSVLRFVIPPEVGEASTASVKIPWKANEMRNNSGRIFRFGNSPGILVRTSAGELRAFTAVCTHLACTVQYRPDLEHIWCACHNGHFDLTGRNIAGPPPGPLAPYAVLACPLFHLLGMRGMHGGHGHAGHREVGSDTQKVPAPQTNTGRDGTPPR